MGPPEVDQGVAVVTHVSGELSVTLARAMEEALGGERCDCDLPRAKVKVTHVIHLPLEAARVVLPPPADAALFCLPWSPQSGSLSDSLYQRFKHFKWI